MLVTFKTDPGYYEQEKEGRKNNTVRKVNSSELKFQALEKGLVDEIQIVCSGNIEMNFRRKITDITYWEDLVIITWEHKEDE